MNTTITLTVVQQPGESTVEITDAIEAGFGEFDRIVAKFTRFNDVSELAELNRNSGKWHEVDPEFFKLIEMMLDISRLSGGAYDPTVIDFLETYGYDKNYDFSKLDKPELDALVQKVLRDRKSWEDIELDYEARRVRLASSQRIDLGGIGKGYAIDLAFEQLNKFANFIVDAGGDIRTKGTNERGEPWQLGLYHQSDLEAEKQLVGSVAAHNTAMACSGSWARRVKQFHHIINPASGRPVDGMTTVYVQAPNATLADAWSTALFVGGKDALKNRHHQVEALLLGDNAIKTNNFPL